MIRFLALLLVSLLAITSQALARGAATVTTPIILVTAFFVSPTGSDAAAGTSAKVPFLTLGRAQTAMRGSGTKVTYVRAGSYAPAATIALTSSDNGETWSYYPPDGYITADITGGSTNGSNGLSSIYSLDTASNVTINGLALHNFSYAGVASEGGVASLTVKNNNIYNGFNVALSNAGGFQCYGCSNTVISHNVVHDIAAFGIGLSQVNGNISGLRIDGNVLYNICTGLDDCGALYVYEGVTGQTVATDLQITNNYVRDGNTTGSGGTGSSLYNDDCVSNMTMTGNIVSGKSGSQGVHYHGGANIHVNHNLIDLSTFGQNIASFQTSTTSVCTTAMNGNQFEHNIVISNGAGGGYNLLSGSPGNSPTIIDNSYFNYGAGTLSHGGNYTDTVPTTQNPQLSCWVYLITSGSPVFNSPVSFAGLPTSWGPPGYHILQSGSVPSSPHTC